MEMAELDKRWQDLESASRPSSAQLRQYLKTVRELKIRDSEAVVRWGALLLSKHAATLSFEELWLVKEQVAIAAMDGPNVKLALQLVDQIRKQFPDSKRGDRLTGMYNECQGRMDEAQEWYEKIMKEQAHNPGALKRQIAQVAARGDGAAAIKLLTTYVGVYASDCEAWEELASMYLQAAHHQQAAFCLEEALLLNPGSIALHLLYAEVQYTIGSPAALKVARQYYASGLHLSGGTSPRALLGITASTAALGAQKGAKSADQDGLAAAAAETLVRQNRRLAPDKVPFVLKVLAAQGYPTIS
mmetsp:Transcript_9694/g.29206  ORF Transcript_9694/g.29206 Transcript_9694/m.29206 type:complete len:301 (+) Transcript_9694:224-1126(+)|eukprot:CAMPEP_0206146208 /NCGR_PEP_ID=MMETSP1473-20131121/29700_1 /ASSEMBLY_ACC=CAM_ASM_001109 /TAXON_ID=1461547 /ORGANISM="Stichococcus sp, Strain RCC1054" /LENGTH=300 /DNA_ID=CAMNT_0053542679 /DNA_START=146 /DNA_END=1048 /DNA_ORIENTATION=+